MRLVKYLTLAIPMSRNQAKFFIKRGRVTTDGKVQTDPDFEITTSCYVIFDGKPISIIKYRYIMLHKPPSYVCASNDKKQKSVLELIKNRSEDRIYHFANILSAPLTGVVLISDDIRWTSRMRLRLQKKPWTYQVRLKHVIQEKQVCQLKEIFSETTSVPIIERDNCDPNTIRLKLNQSQGINIASNLGSLNLAIEYQGRQHYEAIEFFGGEKGFKKRQILDEKKRLLLKEHNINLLEWKYTIEMTKQRVRKEINKII